MTDQENSRTSSTTWEWRKVRVTARRTPAPGKASAEGRPTALSHRDWRQPVTVVLRYRGGRECWVELRGRGATIRVPGHIALVDVLARLNGMSQEAWSSTTNGR